MNITTAFTAGTTYTTRSICDYDCIIAITVAKRTAKTITTTAGKLLRVFIWDGVEHVRPWGNFSMSPSIGADDAEVAA